MVCNKFKFCSECKEFKKKNSFSTRKDSLDGLRNQCKDCQSEWFSNNYAQNSEKRIAQVKIWNDANKLKTGRYKKKYAKNNREKIKIANKNVKHVRRARIKNNTYEIFSISSIFERDNYICGICFSEINKDLIYPDPLSKSIDHIIPISKGGGHIKSNVQASHLVCNLNKRDKIPEDLNEKVC